MTELSEDVIVSCSGLCQCRTGAVLERDDRRSVPRPKAHLYPRPPLTFSLLHVFVLCFSLSLGEREKNK